MVLAVLSGWAVADTVHQSGLQAVEIGAHDIRPGVNYQPGQTLANSLAHDARFPVIDREALLDGDGGDAWKKVFNAAFEILAAGKSEVVGVTGVSRVHGFGESG